MRRILIVCCCCSVCALILFLLWFFSVNVHSTTSVSSYLSFHEPVTTYLIDQIYFLPDYSVVIENKDASYTYIYKEESLSMDQFYIHLVLRNVDPDERGQFLQLI